MNAEPQSKSNLMHFSIGISAIIGLSDRHCGDNQPVTLNPIFQATFAQAIKRSEAGINTPQTTWNSLGRFERR